MKTKARYWSYVILIAIALGLLIIPFLFIDISMFSSLSYLRNLMLTSGRFGYFLLIMLLIASVPLPIPSTPIVLSGGYVYGAWVGTMISLLSIAIGSSISFWLVRFFGRPILNKLVDKRHFLHFNHILKKRGLAIVFISYALPIFPSDSISAILGLTRTSYHLFLVLLILGHIPRLLIINALGTDLYFGLSWKTFYILFAGIILILIAFFREKIKRFLFKELKEIEEEVAEIEKEAAGIKKEVVILNHSLKKDVKFVEKEMGLAERKLKTVNDRFNRKKLRKGKT